MYDVRILPPAYKFFKKLKDKKLKAMFKEAIERIAEDYTIGEMKTGDLRGVYSLDVYYNRTNYELAYTVEIVNDTVIVVIMAGTRENFYSELKLYIKNSKVQ